MTLRKLSVPALGAAAAMALMAGAAHAGAPNLIVNGSFETGDFTGWAFAANSFPMYVDTTNPEDGAFAAQIAGYSNNPDTLYQTITSTTAGEVYDLSFWRTQLGGGPTISLVVTWDGATVFSELNPGAQPYQNFTAQVVGTGSDTLMFTDANDPAFTYLDNVSLTDTGQSAGVPEPAAWALMIAGFGLAGAGLRSSRRRASAAA